MFRTLPSGWPCGGLLARLFSSVAFGTRPGRSLPLMKKMGRRGVPIPLLRFTQDRRCRVTRNRCSMLYACAFSPSTRCFAAPSPSGYPALLVLRTGHHLSGLCRPPRRLHRRRLRRLSYRCGCSRGGARSSSLRHSTILPWPRARLGFAACALSWT